MSQIIVQLMQRSIQTHNATRNRVNEAQKSLIHVESMPIRSPATLESLYELESIRSPATLECFCEDTREVKTVMQNVLNSFTAEPQQKTRLSFPIVSCENPDTKETDSVRIKKIRKKSQQIRVTAPRMQSAETPRPKIGIIGGLFNSICNRVSSQIRYFKYGPTI